MNKNLLRDTRRYSLPWAVLTVLLFLVLGSMLFWSGPRSTLRPADLNLGEVAPLHLGWQLQQPDGSWKELGALPQSLDIPQDSIILRRTLPEYRTGSQVLAFRNQYHQVELFDAQGTLLFEYGVSGNAPFGSLLGNRLCLVELPKALSGSEITLRLTGLYGHRFSVPTFALGTSGSILMASIVNNRGVLILACVLSLVSMGLLTTFVSALLCGGRGRNKAFSFHSGMFCAVCALWLCTDCSLSQFLLADSIASCLLSFFSFMLLPFFFLSAVYALCHRLTVWVRLTQLLLLLNLLVQALLQAFGVLDLPQMLLATHALLLLSVILGLSLLFLRIRTSDSYYAKALLAAVALLSLSALCALTEFYVLPPNDNSRLFRFGLYAALAVLAWMGIRRVFQLMQENKQALLWQEMATLDPLTGLGNRAALEQEFSRLPHKEGSTLVFMLDLNNLKTVNDTLGHRAGDILLKNAALCLEQTFSPQGLCFRLGGDEFAVLVPNCLEKPEQWLARFKATVQNFNQSGTLVLSIACGWAESTSAEPDLKQLLAKADKAMYQDKRRCKQTAQS